MGITYSQLAIIIKATSVRRKTLDRAVIYRNDWLTVHYHLLHNQYCGEIKGIYSIQTQKLCLKTTSAG